MKQLLSYKYKIVGLICVILASVFYTPLLLQGTPIQSAEFSALSSEISNDFAQNINSNLVEKFILLIFISGLSLIIFSKEKK